MEHNEHIKHNGPGDTEARSGISDQGDNSPKVFAVFVMANSIKTFFVGLSDDLRQSVEAVKANGDPHSFTSRFGLHDLLYYELYSTHNAARNREQKIRSLKKTAMLELISKMNPEGCDIFPKFLRGETPQVLEKERVIKKRKYKRKSSYSATVYSLRSISSVED